MAARLWGFFLGETREHADVFQNHLQPIAQLRSGGLQENKDNETPNNAIMHTKYSATP